MQNSITSIGAPLLVAIMAGLILLVFEYRTHWFANRRKEIYRSTNTTLTSVGLLSSIFANRNGRSVAGQFFREDYDRAIIPQLILSSNKAFLWGFAFTATVPMLRERLERGVASGLKIRFLLIEPYSDAAKMAIHGSNTQNADEFNRAVDNSLLLLSDIAKKAPSGTLDVRVINYLPPFTVVAVDPDLPTGRMLVRIASFRMDKTKIPWFELTVAEDRKWFNVFVDQFESIWREATPWNGHPE